MNQQEKTDRLKNRMVVYMSNHPVFNNEIKADKNT